MLDTNICLYIMKRQPPAVAKRFSECRQGDVVISSITLAELEYGIYKSRKRAQSQNRQALDALLKSIPAVSCDELAAQSYALVRAAAPDRKRDALDKLIASYANSLNLTLVTNNLSDFQAYPDMNLENRLEEQSH